MIELILWSLLILELLTKFIMFQPLLVLTSVLSLLIQECHKATQSLIVSTKDLTS